MQLMDAKFQQKIQKYTTVSELTFTKKKKEYIKWKNKAKKKPHITFQTKYSNINQDQT
jgi:hypothetical protein